MTVTYRAISTDDHVVEPPDVWQKRVPAKFKEQAPRVIQENGRAFWVIEGRKFGQGIGGLGAVAGRRPEEFTPDFARGYADMRPGCYDPVARLKDMETDGVDGQVIFPSLPGLGGQGLLQVQDPDLRLACIQVYNDWLAGEWCAVDPERLIPQCILPMWDVSLAAQELERAAELGHKAIVFSGNPHTLGLPPLGDPSWDPLWETAQGMDIPVSLHHGGGGAQAMSDFRGTKVLPTEAAIINNMTSNIGVVGSLVFAGVLERFPTLKFISVESGLGWVPYFLEMADDLYQRQRFWASTAIKTVPSQLFRRQVYVNFWNERAGVEVRHHVGVDNILWESDYPHSITCWPNSWQCINKCLEGVPEEERRKILVDNAVRLFHLTSSTG